MEIKRNPFKIVAAAVLFVLLLLISNSNSAFAASGGRMGGSSFHSSSKSSLSSPKSSLSSTRSSSSSSSSSPLSLSSNRSYHRKTLVVLDQQSCNNSGHADSGNLVKPWTWIETAYAVIAIVCILLVLLRAITDDYEENTDKTSVPAETTRETTSALLRHPDCCISAYSSVHVKRNITEGEKQFHQLSVEERAKLDKETLVNISNIEKESSTILRSTGSNNDHIVTIHVETNAEEGKKRFHQFATEDSAKPEQEPLINVNDMKNEHIVITILVAASSKDLRKALQELASLS